MYALDAEHLTVWVEAFDPDAGYRAGVLCRRHADAMVVPIGWMLDDRRQPAPKLFNTREAPGAPAPSRTKERRNRSVVSDPTGQLELIMVDENDTPDAAEVDEAAAAAADQPVDEPADGPAVPWSPRFDQTDDLDGLLVTKSPLLSRAFGNLDQRRHR